MIDKHEYRRSLAIDRIRKELTNHWECFFPHSVSNYKEIVAKEVYKFYPLVYEIANIYSRLESMDEILGEIHIDYLERKNHIQKKLLRYGEELELIEAFEKIKKIDDIQSKQQGFISRITRVLKEKGIL